MLFFFLEFSGFLWRHSKESHWAEQCLSLSSVSDFYCTCISASGYWASMQVTTDACQTVFLLYFFYPFVIFFFLKLPSFIQECCCPKAGTPSQTKSSVCVCVCVEQGWGKSAVTYTLIPLTMQASTPTQSYSNMDLR